MTYEESLVALADPTRRQIYERVTRGQGSVAEISKGFAISRPAVSQHLKVLSDAGLVTAKKQGTRRIYSAAPDGLSELRRYLDALWEDVLGDFAKSFEKDH